MRFRHLTFITTMLTLTACNSANKPSDTNFRIAINQYLAKHGRSCTWIALEAAGLVRSSNTVAVTPGIFGSSTPHRVKRYEPTAEGRRYFQQVAAVLGQSAGSCYGGKTVDAIVKGTEPAKAGPYSQVEVTYTYKIADLAQ